MELKRPNGFSSYRQVAETVNNAEWPCLVKYEGNNWASHCL